MAKAEIADLYGTFSCTSFTLKLVFCWKLSQLGRDCIVYVRVYWNMVSILPKYSCRILEKILTPRKTRLDGANDSAESDSVELMT